MKIEILEPEMKEILETCARYNLDQVKDPDDIAKSSEVLEEIRHAETIENIRITKPMPLSHSNGCSNIIDKTPTSSLPNSPRKISNPVINGVDERPKNTRNGKHINGETRNAISNKGVPIKRNSNTSLYDNSPESPLPPPNLSLIHY